LEEIVFDKEAFEKKYKEECEKRDKYWTSLILKIGHKCDYPVLNADGTQHMWDGKPMWSTKGVVICVCNNPNCTYCFPLENYAYVSHWIQEEPENIPPHIREYNDKGHVAYGREKGQYMIPHEPGINYDFDNSIRSANIIEEWYTGMFFCKDCKKAYENIRYEINDPLLLPKEEITYGSTRIYCPDCKKRNLIWENRQLNTEPLMTCPECNEGGIVAIQIGYY
jgi:uncharacterized protein YbaR (Trm112 family)